MLSPNGEGAGMAKQRLTAVQIRDKVNERIAMDGALDGDCRDCRVEKPRRVPAGEPAAHYGGNWNIDTFQGPAPCHAMVQRIVADVRRDCDCSPPD
jgi:hypothetical protein